MQKLFKEVIEHALSILDSFIDFLNTHLNDVHKVGRWQPPWEGYFKLNIDGALFHNLQEVGLGAIVRNCKVDTTMAASIREENIQSLQIIESLAILRVIQLCLQLEISNVIIESNCQVVVKEIQSSESSLSMLGNIFQDIQNLVGRFQ